MKTQQSNFTLRFTGVASTPDWHLVNPQGQSVLVVSTPSTKEAKSVQSKMVWLAKVAESPAPTEAAGITPPIDWDKELENLKKQKLAAYNYVKDALMGSVEGHVMTLHDYVDGFTHVCLKYWPSKEHGEARVYLKASHKPDLMVPYASETLLELAANVQKAIAERGNP
jgi:hypothetical protein